MMTNFGRAAIALALLAGTSPAHAQSDHGDDDVRSVVVAIPLAPAQQTIVYRSVIPQRRGREPVVHERAVTRPATPVVLERVVTGAFEAYAVARPRAPAANAYVVGARVPAATRPAPLPPVLVAEVPARGPNRSWTRGGRVLLVDPNTGVIIADVTP